VTTAVGADVALLVPNWFRAKTVTLILWPTSEDDSRCCAASPPKPSQLLPAVSHRCHR